MVVAAMQPMRNKEERIFTFVNKQREGKSTCHKTLMKAETYSVKKQVQIFQVGQAPMGQTLVEFKASARLPKPCNPLVKKCVPAHLRKKIDVLLGWAGCHAGELNTVEGIKLLVELEVKQSYVYILHCCSKNLY